MHDVMPLSPTWLDISFRLVLTVVFGSAIGINRQIGGHAAGFRTTVLVALAACIAMIQANVLLSVTGKTPASFGEMDTLRLPLGILTGVGFIGGCAILRRGDFVTGVTTAATLWIMTALGLCFGGGQLGVGCAAGVMALIVLSPMKILDAKLARKQKAAVTISIGHGEATPDLSAVLAATGCTVRYISQERSSDATKVEFELLWKATPTNTFAFDILKTVEQQFKVERFELFNPAA